MNGNALGRSAVAILGLLVGFGLVWSAGCRRRTEPTAGPNNPPAKPAPAVSIGPARPGPTLDEVVATRKTWDVRFHSYIGKQAPDFKVTDLAGRTYTLSALKGKDVLITIWATWCPPCRAEVPDLIELRKAVPETDLAILAISFVERNNTEQMIRAFSEQYKLNYVVAAVDSNSIPAPYSAVEAIPAAFFVGRDGTMKLATVGPVPLADMMAILKAGPAKAL